jgi:hypothetical protein
MRLLHHERDLLPQTDQNVHHAHTDAQPDIRPAQQWQQRWCWRLDTHAGADLDPSAELDPSADFDPRADLDAGADHQRRADRNSRAGEHADCIAGHVLWRFRGQSPERWECDRRHRPVGRHRPVWRHRRNPYPDIG